MIVPVLRGCYSRFVLGVVCGGAFCLQWCVSFARSRIYFCVSKMFHRFVAIAPPRSSVRSSCVAPVVPSRLNHGAEETFLAQKGGREEGRQEEGQAFGQAQREEARVEAPFPQAQVEEGRR